MELILEVSATMVMVSSAMVIFNFTAFCLILLYELLIAILSHTMSLISVTANELRLDTSGVEDLDKLLINTMFEVGLHAVKLIG